MSVLNLSFAACGFLGMYHLGAAGAFLRHGDKLLGSLGACAGASAGALVAAVMITAPDKLEECKDFTYRFAQSVREQWFGAMTPGYDFMLTLRDGIEDILPSDAHTLASGRVPGLCLIDTIPEWREPHCVQLYLQALLASSFVPVYAGFKPVEFRGQKWIDGGLTDSLPILPVGRTITVSPFTGPQDVCPVHRGRFNTRLSLANMNIMLSMENVKRLNQALFPPPTSGMRRFHEQGFHDAVRFLKREAWMS